jgi:hypothetical protein
MAIEKRLRCNSTTPAARNPEDGESERARQESDVRAPTRISGGSRSKEPTLAENVHRERLIQSQAPSAVATSPTSSRVCTRARCRSLLVIVIVAHICGD